MFHDATVFVVDDDDQARQSVCALVRSMRIHAESFPSAEDFLESYDQRRGGCLVTDLRMLGMSGLELQDALRASGVTLPVIVITAHARTSITVRAMKQGAVMLLDKPYDDDDLWDAIREALQRDEAQRDEQHNRQEVQQRIDSLTDKEQEVMRMMVEGKANKVIARLLDVSIRTVESRRHEVFSKMHADSLAGLVRMVVDCQSHQKDVAI